MDSGINVNIEGAVPIIEKATGNDREENDEGSH